MAFGFKSAYDRLKELYDTLDDDEKSKFKAEIEDINKAEDEREIDKIEENKAENATTADDKAEDVREESEQIAKDFDRAEDLGNEDEANETAKTDDTVEPKSVSAEETQVEVPSNRTPEDLNDAPKIDYDAMTKTLDGLNAKYTALEKKVGDLFEMLADNKSTDIGISGFGTNEIKNEETDKRLDYIKRSLGGRM